jgi:hypothetical protein
MAPDVAEAWGETDRASAAISVVSRAVLAPVMAVATAVATGFIAGLASTNPDRCTPIELTSNLLTTANLNV